ncbi:MAG: hypothetical protein KJZ86_01425 [Caldilineaceae bacterium]|nr:hypothetical protein [Caldilineaceae bacterium]HRJ43407.1 hypothetical protein [Caldilineaceae bacterium]
MELTLTPEIESAIKKQASQAGVTPEKIALDGLRVILLPEVAPGPIC